MLLLLAGCAAPVAVVLPDAGDTTPLAYPVATRVRMMAILDAEWREWGARVLDGRRGPVGDAEGPMAEQDAAAFSKVLAYWAAVGEAGYQGFIDRNKRAFIARSGAGMCTAEERAADGRDVIWGCQPWSAAFISYVMRASGIDRAEFVRSAGHREYVDGLIAAGDRFGGRATFLGHEIGGYSPVVGDLICADRARRAPITTLAERRAEMGASRPMHCDLVAGVVPGEILAIGGNVAQAVTAVRYRTDGQGRLVRNARRWFVVFENRIGVE